MADRKHTPLILVTGSDRRQVYAAEKLASLDNTEVCAYLTDGEPKGARVIKTLGELPTRADMLLLPMPCSAGGGLEIPACGRLTCAELTPYLAKNAVVAGGKMPTAMIEYFNSLGFTTADYLRREELAVKNCVPTAEGALALAMREMDVTISGTRALIIGWGRVAKACARLFGATGARVCVTARNLGQLAEAESCGFEAFELEQLFARAGGFPLIINTVPAPVLTREIIEETRRGCLVIDLASQPGGTDFAAAAELSRRAVHALSLPGKCAPVTAGEIIAEAALNIYNERSGRNVT